MTAAARRAANALNNADAMLGYLVQDLVGAAGYIAEAIEEVVPTGWGVEVERVGLTGTFSVTLMAPNTVTGTWLVSVTERGGVVLVDGSPLADWVARVTS